MAGRPAWAPQPLQLRVAPPARACGRQGLLRSASSPEPPPVCPRPFVCPQLAWRVPKSRLSKRERRAAWASTPGHQSRGRVACPARKPSGAPTQAHPGRRGFQAARGSGPAVLEPLFGLAGGATRTDSVGGFVAGRSSGRLLQEAAWLVRPPRGSPGTARRGSGARLRVEAAGGAAAGAAGRAGSSVRQGRCGPGQPREGDRRRSSERRPVRAPSARP